jgi:hypothetical protein
VAQAEETTSAIDAHSLHGDPTAPIRPLGCRDLEIGVKASRFNTEVTHSPEQGFITLAATNPQHIRARTGLQSWSKAEVMEKIGTMIDGIDDYPNFKDSVKDRELHERILMSRLQW